jgi:carbon-monoxide dehydrogenase catalytic subunit
MIATEVQDILYGTPRPVPGDINMGVLGENTVNVVVHGHEPNLSEMVALASQQPELIEEAKKAGAEGITVVGVCCTGNELLIRHGIPIASSMRSQELVLATGLVEAMVVDIQCVMQGLCAFAKNYHTKLVTTSVRARIEGAEHMEFTEDHGLEEAKKLVRMAIDNYANRDSERTFLPEASREGLIAGFSHEAIKYMLGGRFRESYRPLNDNIMNGRIRGVVGVVGCVQAKGSLDVPNYAKLVKKLISKDFLVVQTGCAAMECAKEGLMSPEMKEVAGPGLREVCEAVGMPPVLHAGSCVDNSRILIACSEMVKEGGLGGDISELPVAGACFEWMHEKAISIGQYFVSSGVFTAFGIELPVFGSPAVQKYLTEEIETEVGGKWAFGLSSGEMATAMIDHINKKRAALDIDQEHERVLYDMEARRELKF